MSLFKFHRPLRSILLGSVAALLASHAAHAGTANNYTGSSSGSLQVTSNWSLGTLPTIANDAVFTATTGIRPLTAGNLTVNSFNVTAVTGTFSIRNETATSTNSILTLGGAGSSSNSTAGTAAGDLLFAASGSTFNIIGPNGGSGTGVLQVTLGQSGNFNIAGTSTISAAIGDSGSGFGFAKTGAGTLTLTGANTYSGTTTVSGGTLEIGTGGALANTSNVTVNSGGTLLLSGTDNNKINNSAAVTLAGGTITTNGSASLSETVGALTLSSSSIIDFATTVGGNTLSFADSSSNTWTGTLSVWNWTNGTDHLFFGSSSSGLTGDQLGQISLYSDSGTTFLGTGAISLGGEINIAPVPEPSTVLAGVGLLLLIGYRERRSVLRLWRSASAKSTEGA